MSKVSDGTDEPRAVVHKRILDVADDQPEASVADIAEAVSAATPDLVERVLEQYGDPGASDGTDSEATDDEQSGGSNEATTPQQSDGEQDDADPDLTEAQLETVSVVHDHPTATQGEIAERLGVSRATVSRRLNDIPGFEWANRETVTETLFDSADLHPEPPADAATGETIQEDGAVPGDQQVPAAIGERLDAVEERLDSLDSRDERHSEDGPQLRPELTQKVVHAAMKSDRVSEDEELELLAALLE